MVINDNKIKYSTFSVLFSLNIYIYICINIHKCIITTPNLSKNSKKRRVVILCEYN